MRIASRFVVVSFLALTSACNRDKATAPVAPSASAPSAPLPAAPQPSSPAAVAEPAPALAADPSFEGEWGFIAHKITIAKAGDHLTITSGAGADKNTRGAFVFDGKLIAAESPDLDLRAYKISSGKLVGKRLVKEGASFKLEDDTLTGPDNLTGKFTSNKSSQVVTLAPLENLRGAADGGMSAEYTGENPGKGGAVRRGDLLALSWFQDGGPTAPMIIERTGPDELTVQSFKDTPRLFRWRNGVVKITPSASGELTADAIDKVFQKQRSALTACYTSVFKLAPQASAMMQFFLTIDGEGKVTAAAVQNTFGGGRLTKCLQTLPLTWTFPKPSGTVTVDYGLLIGAQPSK